MSHSTATDLVGQRYGRLTVLNRAGSFGRHSAWECACDCGNSKVVRANSLRRGNTRSCGCIVSEGNSTRHGQHRSKTYKIWSGMKQRCLCVSNANFSRYGGRGITVCERWLVFENFIADMGEKPAGMSLDRIDNDGNYEPGNCRWATIKTQARNMRSNVRWTHNGECLTIAEWAERAGIDRTLLRNRVARGWSIEEAMQP